MNANRLVHLSPIRRSEGGWSFTTVTVNRSTGFHEKARYRTGDLGVGLWGYLPTCVTWYRDRHGVPVPVKSWTRVLDDEALDLNGLSAAARRNKVAKLFA